MGMTDLIYGTKLTDEQIGLLDTLNASSHNLLNLIRNILDFNNLESENRKLQIEPFSLKESIAEIAIAFGPQAQKKGINLKTVFAPDLPDKLFGNTRGVLQILRNLTDNAIKFTEQGEVILSAEQVIDGTAKPAISITVTDTGMGIGEERLEDLFQPFAQADASFSRSFDGAGIGLSLCRKYVDKMGGRINVSSTIGKGTQFAVILQMDPVTNTGKAKKTETVVPDTSFSGKYPLRILIAEDNALNQKLITKVLEKLGYTPEIANNGQEAVERARAEAFDLILMDLQMPKMDGLEAARIITDQKDTTSAKPDIIALTANVSEDVKEACLKAGMVDYTTKPLKLNHLVKLLQNLP